MHTLCVEPRLGVRDVGDLRRRCLLRACSIVCELIARHSRADRCETRFKRPGWDWRRLVVQAGCGHFYVNVDQGAARHREYRTCCSSPLSQLHGNAREGRMKITTNLYRTSGTELTFVLGSALDLIEYSDTDCAGKSNDRRWVVITLGGVAVRWRDALRGPQQSHSTSPWVKG